MRKAQLTRCPEGNKDERKEYKHPAEISGEPQALPIYDIPVKTKTCLPYIYNI
ncbi:hypothetical protein IX321_002553 [Bacteroides pyogenes]|nr:hypothetical protein [Bacteroides pyogenes]MBR8709743.1 hypothetical protein [Bacteroides pyogenes]MBR8718880.1 hypothetical protein [Bacteroides pyogenes]MBR8748084.1 hypothetical protein [Bacteroides pyogenes]MBR8758376.1 hypothetical protein [Bacteroides pyogenes]